MNTEVIKNAISKVNWVTMAGAAGMVLSLIGGIASNYASKKLMEEMVAKEVSKAVNK